MNRKDRRHSLKVQNKKLNFTQLNGIAQQINAQIVDFNDQDADTRLQTIYELCVGINLMGKYVSLNGLIDDCRVFHEKNNPDLTKSFNKFFTPVYEEIKEIQNKDEVLEMKNHIIENNDGFILLQQKKIEDMEKLNDALTEVLQTLISGIEKVDVTIEKSRKDLDPETNVDADKFKKVITAELCLTLAGELIKEDKYTKLHEMIAGSEKLSYRLEHATINVDTLEKLKPLQIQYDEIKKELGIK